MEFDPSHSGGSADTRALVGARSVAEASLWAQFDQCACGGFSVDWDLVSLDAIRADVLAAGFDSSCAGCGLVRHLSFFLPPGESPAPYHYARAADEASQLYDAVEWWGFSHLFEGLVSDGTQGSAPVVEQGTDRVARLTQTATAMDEVLRFLPEGADELPASAVWTPWSLAVVRDDGEAFTRSALEQRRAACWRRVKEFSERSPAPDNDAQADTESTFELDADGEQDDEHWPVIGTADRYPVARSVEEELLYVALHPCACGTSDFGPVRGYISTPDGQQVNWYRGVCAHCGDQRQFVFREHDDFAPTPPSCWATSPAPSALIDPGQWWQLAAALLAPAADSGTDAASHAGAPTPEDLRRSAAALDEVLKFIPESEDHVPPSAFRSDMSREVYDDHPSRFGRTVLLARRHHYLQASDETTQGITHPPREASDD